MDTAQGILRIGNDAALFDKGVHTQWREKPRSAVGRQDVVGACVVIAKRFRGIASQEDGACIADPCHDLKGIFRDDLKVLGSNGICRVNEFIHGLTDKNIAIILDGFADDICAGKLLDKAVDFFCHGLGQFLVGREQDGTGHGIMLCLGQKVRRHIAGIGCPVCDHQDLAGAGDRVNAGHTKAGLLGQGNENISGARDLVDTGNGLRPVSHCCDRLCAAHLVYFVRAGNIRRDDGTRCSLAGGIGRRSDDDTLDTCDLGRDHVHQNTGGIDCSSAGYITSRDPDRRHLLSQDDPFLCGRDPALCDLFFVIGADIGCRSADDLNKFRCQFSVGSLDLLPADTDGLLCQSAFVEFLFQFKKGFIAPGADIVDDVSNRLLIFRIAGRASAQQGFQGTCPRIFRQLHDPHAGHTLTSYLFDNYTSF